MAPKRSAKPSAVPLIVLSILSIATGITVHVLGVHKPKYDNLGFLGTAGTPQLKKALNLPKSWPGTDVYEKNFGEAWRFLLVLIVFFQDALRHHVGQAILFLMTCCAMPIFAFFAIEAIKDGRHRYINVGTLIFVTSLGQLIMVGAATPIFFIPLYALSRWSEPSTMVHPLPPPASWKFYASQFCSVLASATIFLTTFTPLDSAYFVTNNLLFQFFPLAYVPLLFLPSSKTVISTAGSASAREKPRLDAALSYQLLSYLAVPLYYFGLYWGGKDLFNGLVNGLQLQSAGPYLLFWDFVGVLASMYFIVLVDSFTDEAKVLQGGQRVHDRRLLLEDIIIGTPGALLFGPGWAAARYFQRREVLAERIRFGATAKDV